MSSVPVRELREWNTQLTLDPLAPGDPRYVPLQESGRAAVDEMMATILLAVETTTQLLSGPSGSGKTTELGRLRSELDNRGYHAVLIDITRYVNESSPIDITEILIALALGAHDILGPAGAGEAGFGRRLRDLLGRLSIDLDVGGISANVSDEGITVSALGASVAVDLKRELKSSEPFVAQLRAALAYHVGTLYEEVADFLATLLSDGEGEGAVLIVDGLDKLQGTAENDLAVQASIEALFVNHASKLKFGSHHLVYTVPTSLQFMAAALPYDGRVIPVPVPHVRPRPGGPTEPVERTIAELRKVVEARIPISLVFASEGDLDLLIAASGGHLRDLFTLLKQLVSHISRWSVELPVTAGHIEEAIRDIAHDFSAITQEQARFLRAVADGNGDLRPAAADVPLMMRLLRSHLLLSHLNGEDWYEVHPLARRALDIP